MSTAPPATSPVPANVLQVHDSFNIRLAIMLLKTSPDASKVLSSGSGSVVIWIVEPMMLASRKSDIPICHRRRRYGARRVAWSSLQSSSMCDLRWRVRPTDWTHVDSRPTTMPTATPAPGEMSPIARERECGLLCGARAVYTGSKVGFGLDGLGLR